MGTETLAPGSCRRYVTDRQLRIDHDPGARCSSFQPRLTLSGSPMVNASSRVRIACGSALPPPRLGARSGVLGRQGFPSARQQVRRSLPLLPVTPHLFGRTGPLVGA
jgi:hypothetical protein